MKSSTIAIIGGRGRLGAALARLWKDRFPVHVLTRNDLELSHLPSLREFLSTADFDVLVNCAAETRSEECEAHPMLAKTINTEAPKVMAEELSKKSKRLIHISTDYVFDGKKPPGEYYTEEDDAHPISVYGQTKRDGEIAVQEAGTQHVIMRVSWLFGPDKASFVDTMIDRAMESDKIEAVGDKTSCPTYVDDAARWIEPFLSGLKGGLYHTCNLGACSWRDYAEHAIRAAADLGVPVKTRDVDFIRMSDIPGFAAIRPPHTPMSVDKLASEIGFMPRPWQDAVTAYVQQKFRQ